MFGVKVEQSQPYSMHLPMTATEDKKRFFGVEVDDPHALQGPEYGGDDFSSSSNSHTNTSPISQRRAVWILAMALAICAAVGLSKSMALSAARDDLKAAQTKSAELEAKVSQVQAQLSLKDDKVNKLESEKTKLGVEVTAKSNQISELEAKLKRGGSHASKKPAAKPHKK
jgi:septal ring factor EnvC (AmiA/AmiB activator)